MASLDSTTKPSLGRLWGGVYGRRTKFSAGIRDGGRERPIASALFSLYPPWTFPGRPASPARHQERRPAQGSGQGLSSFAHLDRKTGRGGDPRRNPCPPLAGGHARRRRERQYDRKQAAASSRRLPPPAAVHRNLSAQRLLPGDCRRVCRFTASTGRSAGRPTKREREW